MSVRQIPKNYRNLTGLGASDKANMPFFESTLERDCLTILDFDPNVLTYDVQPVSVPWTDCKGKERLYTPDTLIQYYSGTCSFSSFDTVLCEVKYRNDIQKNWEELKLKFKAAIKYAKDRKWRFKLFTEKEIRTSYMENARFLLRYKNQEFDDAHAQMLLHRLAEMRESTIEALICAVFNDKWAQAELIPSVWFLIANRRIATDLTIPLTMSSKIWLDTLGET